jgi:thiol-disulfide isomerase/thioredoxin
MTSITLYHADWCGHCQNFKPTWKKIKDWAKDNSVRTYEYEDTKNNQEVKNAGITGFPTIIINKNGKKMEVETTSFDEITRMLTSGSQNGGANPYLNSNNNLMSNQIDFKQKYLKYKKKYQERKYGMK